MATVEVTFTPLPAHVRTARLVATAVARRSGVAEPLLDEVRLAVGEACSRAVEAHRAHCPTEPVRIELCDLGERFEVAVIDAALAEADSLATDSVSSDGGDQVGTPGASVLPPVGPFGEQGPGFAAAFGLAVISGLVDDVQVSPTDKGLSIRMSWPAAMRAG